MNPVLAGMVFGKCSLSKSSVRESGATLNIFLSL
jgi:hypothetical protein